jgi:hypothetical protein
MLLIFAKLVLVANSSTAEAMAPKPTVFVLYIFVSPFQ